MRAALIGPVPPRLGGAVPGGVATHQVHLAAGLQAAGVDAPLLATNISPGAPFPARGEAPFPLYRLDTQRRVFIDRDVPRTVRYALHLVRRRPDGGGSRRGVLRNMLGYRRFIATVQPDLLHVQHPLERALYARLVQLVEGSRLPLVITAHSLFGEHDDETIERLMRPNLRAADCVIAVSPHIARQAMALGVAADRLRVIRSGVDTDRFRPRDRQAARLALGIADEAPLILFVGNLEPRKQVDVLLRAVALVGARLPGTRLVIVGSGASAGALDQTQNLMGLAAELGLSDGEPRAQAVHFVGPVADDVLMQYYAAADVFALPSSAEAQGIVALEAMASELVVIASAVGGLLDTIEDGRTGCLVPSGDVAALATRLWDVLTDASRRRSIGAAARAVVERDFAWSRAVSATIAVYRDIVTPR